MGQSAEALLKDRAAARSGLMDAADYEYKKILTDTARQTIEENKPTVYVPGLGMVNKKQMMKLMELEAKNTPTVRKLHSSLAESAAERGEKFPTFDQWYKDNEVDAKYTQWKLAGSPGEFDDWMEKMRRAGATSISISPEDRAYLTGKGVMKKDLEMGMYFDNLLKQPRYADRGRQITMMEALIPAELRETIRSGGEPPPMEGYTPQQRANAARYANLCELQKNMIIEDTNRAASEAYDAPVEYRETGSNGPGWYDTRDNTYRFGRRGF